MTTEHRAPYVLRGGREGRARLAVIARVLAEPTRLLLDRSEPLEGCTAVDAGCGGGDVTFELAKRVGRAGQVIGLDFDEDKIVLARAEARRRGIHNVEFCCANVTHHWPVHGVSLVSVRFVLTHLVDPVEALGQAYEALRPGGMIVVQDIDCDGEFCDPTSAAFLRKGELFVEAVRRRGGDPLIGRRLLRLLEAAGFSDVHSSMVQPYGRNGDVKRVPLLTFAAIRDALSQLGLASIEEIGGITAELEAFLDRPDTTVGLPRIFHAWGRKQ
ncbi:class I SAM-dependent methyltransferase [Bradyrhizobium sp. CCGUVB1N3]|uniref:class I SAM-dependent methyltransferase n=1 Tax=Bradyrhizobium sp. CCGUVB1N3 TaxID=2949629 RepID=UPI0020B2B5BF|nr:class I SAM-dependent methyltransferase [Bradyrhizobium sp. CCGUVB1N3]MCP3476011.1 class I SAM-dependent methyltransferase [Bradyrhizobium sp. CCGUVB1N3]